ncbi:MAG: UDP-3-O-(3-hydroxymyristoyl)glucosamine N-acyltransferase [Deltaproteobacteria bacterium]|nr:UDP-3-O-(3-hydroxymyristoyl)glucosamine N-acyltransferase [Deltaproteobacteria bacterium]
MKPMRLSDIAEAVGATCLSDPDFTVAGVAPFETAGETELTCAASPRFLKELAGCRAGALILPVSAEAPPGVRVLAALNPLAAFARAISLFHPKVIREGVHASVAVGADFRAGEGLFAGPGVVIGDKVSLGSRVCLHPNVVLGDGVVLGDDVVLHPGVKVLDRCTVGDRTIIHAGTVIGSDGFGFTQDQGRHLKIPQTGFVSIGSDVEIGANCAVDRATFGATKIGNGVKIDNLVQVAHNCTVGDHAILVAQVGIAGSTCIGQYAILAGQAGIAGHISIGDAAVVGPQAGVGHSVAPGEVVSGTPAIPRSVYLRSQRLVGKLPEWHREYRELLIRVRKLEEMIRDEKS